jgi:uncharacterized surface protein with fasciclin (FAS1) repeats
MHQTRTLRAVAATAVLVFALSACGSDDSDSGASADTKATSTTTAMAAKDTIVDVASGNPDFSTLVSAVTKADLASTLSGTGPFTVFAPTNEAFAKVPADQLNALLADKAQLTKVLTYHVVPGKVLAADLQPTQMVKTVEGQDVDIQVADGKATINGCAITKTDIEASNGVIHVIDAVMTPSILG